MILAIRSMNDQELSAHASQAWHPFCEMAQAVMDDIESYEFGDKPKASSICFVSNDYIILSPFIHST